MERWTEYCSEMYKNKDDNDTVEELMKELEWISSSQKDDTGDYIPKEQVEKATSHMARCVTFAVARIAASAAALPNTVR